MTETYRVVCFDCETETIVTTEEKARDRVEDHREETGHDADYHKATDNVRESDGGE